MAQTNLMSDDFCGYNQAAAPFFWVMEPGQYENTFCLGEKGMACASNNVRPDVINISSFLSGRDNILSKCNPPIPGLVKQDVSQVEQFSEDSGILDNAQFPGTQVSNKMLMEEGTSALIPAYTKEKKSANDTGAISWIPNTFDFLPSDAQDINHIEERFTAQRGGIDTTNVIKHAWNTDRCNVFLDPSRYCGEECDGANGQPETSWLDINGPYLPPLVADPTPITSSLVNEVGAGCGGPQMKNQPQCGPLSQWPPGYIPKTERGFPSQAPQCNPGSLNTPTPHRGNPYAYSPLNQLPCVNPGTVGGTFPYADPVGSSLRMAGY